MPSLDGFSSASLPERLLPVFTAKGSPAHSAPARSTIRKTSRVMSGSVWRILSYAFCTSSEYDTRWWSFMATSPGSTSSPCGKYNPSFCRFPFGGKTEISFSFAFSAYERISRDAVSLSISGCCSIYIFAYNSRLSVYKCSGDAGLSCTTTGYFSMSSRIRACSFWLVSIAFPFSKMFYGKYVGKNGC